MDKPGMEEQSTAWPCGCRGGLHLPWLAAEPEALQLHPSGEGTGSFTVPEGPRELEAREAVSSSLMCALAQRSKKLTLGQGKKN